MSAIIRAPPPGVGKAKRLVGGGEDRAARRAVRRHRRLQPLDPVAVEAVGRLVEQPQGRAAGDDPSQSGALALAGGEHAHRHSREMVEPHEREAPRRIPHPKGERGAERLPFVERRMLVCQRRLGALDRPRGRPQQAGGETDQARLADAVGTAHQRRLARAQSEAQPLEQQPAAAQAGDLLEREQSHGAPARPRWRACRRRRSRNGDRPRGR